MNILKLGLLTLLLVARALAQEPSKEAQELTEKLQLKQFERFLLSSKNLSAEQNAEVEKKFGINPLLTRLALHFDSRYSPEQLKGMLSLWDDPNMQALVGELIGVNAPINQLLSKWAQERMQYVQQIYKAPSNK